MLKKMIIGTVQFGLDYGVNPESAKKMSQEDCDTILNLAKANNISKIDTAEIYGDSIEKIGNYHKKASEKFEVISKFHLPEDVYTTLKHSLHKLSINSYFCILAHRPEQLFSLRTIQDDFVKLKKEGLTSYTGVSIYTNDEFARAIENPFVDVIQFPFNILDNLSQRGQLMKRAKNAGKILHARSAFLQGMLLKALPLPAKLKPLEPYIIRLQEICNQNGLTLPGLALEYVFTNELVDNVVMGHHSASQLKRNIELIKNFKKSEYLQEIDQIKVIESELLNPRNW